MAEAGSLGLVVGIDGAPAQQGAQVVSTALNAIYADAMRTTTAINALNSSLKQTGLTQGIVAQSSAQAAAASLNAANATTTMGASAANAAAQMGKLVPILDTIKKSGVDYATGIDMLAAAHKNGEITSGQLTTGLSKLRTAFDVARDSTKKAHEELGLFGVKAGAVSEGFVLLREGVNMNFTRMSTSVTIFLQRLGLLGGAVELILGPVGAAAAGALVLGLAYEKGAAQAEAFRGAVALTGNAAGITASDLSAYADAGARAVNVGVNTARDLAIAYTATGKIASDVIGTLTTITGDWAVASGQEVDKAGQSLVKAFAGGAAGAKGFDEALNLLSPIQARAVQSAYDQGRAFDAQRISADALNARVSGLANEGLSAVGRAFAAAGKAISEAWSDIERIGRGSSVAEQIASYEKLEQRYGSTGAAGQTYLAGLKAILAAEKEQAAQAALAASSQGNIKTVLDQLAPKYDSVAEGQRKMADEAVRVGRAISDMHAQIVNLVGADDEKELSSYNALLKTLEGTMRGLYTAAGQLKTPLAQIQDQLKVEQAVAGMSPVAAARERARQQGLRTSYDKDGNPNGTAAANAAGDVADQQHTNQLSQAYAQLKLNIDGATASADAWLKSDEAGTQAELMRTASVKAYSDNVSVAIAYEQERSRFVAEAALQGAKQADELSTQADFALELAHASAVSGKALHDVALEQKIYNATLVDERALALAATDAERARIQAIIDRKTKAIEAEDASKTLQSFNEQKKALQDQIDLAQVELSLAGQLPEVRERELAKLREKQEIAAKFPTFDAQQIDALIRMSSIQGTLLGQIKEQNRQAHLFDDAIKQAANSVDRTLTSAIEGALDGQKVTNWGDTWRKVLAQIETEILNIALIKPAIGSVLSTVGLGAAAQQSGYGGLIGGGLLSGGSSSSSSDGSTISLLQNGGSLLNNGSQILGGPSSGSLMGNAGTWAAGQLGLGTPATTLAGWSGVAPTAGYTANIGGDAIAIDGMSGIDGVAASAATEGTGIFAAGGALEAVGAAIPYVGVAIAAYMILSQLFGGKPTVGPGGQLTGTYRGAGYGVPDASATPGFKLIGAGKDNGYDPNVNNPAVAAIGQSISDFVTKMGGTLQETAQFTFGYDAGEKKYIGAGAYDSSVHGTFANAQDAEQAAFFYGLRGSHVTGLGEGKTDALANSKAADLNGLLADLNTGDLYDTLLKDGDAAKTLGTSVAQLTDLQKTASQLNASAAVTATQYIAAIDKQNDAFAALGMDTAKSSAAFANNLNQYLDTLDGSRKPMTAVELQVAQVTAQWNSMIPVLTHLGETADEASTRVQNGLTKSIAQIASGLQSTWFDRAQQATDPSAFKIRQLELGYTSDVHDATTANTDTKNITTYYAKAVQDIIDGAHATGFEFDRLAAIFPELGANIHAFIDTTSSAATVLVADGEDIVTKTARLASEAATAAAAAQQAAAEQYTSVISTVLGSINSSISEMTAKAAALNDAANSLSLDGTLSGLSRLDQYNLAKANYASASNDNLAQASRSFLSADAAYNPVGSAAYEADFNAVIARLQSVAAGYSSGASSAAASIPGVLASIPHFATGADFMVGGSSGVDTNLFTAMLSQGERVQITPTGGSQTDAALLAEIRGLREEVRRLTAVSAQGAMAVKSEIVAGNAHLSSMASGAQLAGAAPVRTAA